MFNDLEGFKAYCKERKWSIDRFTSESTIQFWLCRYIEHIEPNYKVELESNINRYDLSNLTKKEIDIDFGDIDNSKTAIELKYIRDKGSYNIGMFSFYEDIKFLEELILESEKFVMGYCIMFTSIPEMYSKPNKNLKPRNKENLALHESFRLVKTLKGKVTIKTGILNKTLTLRGIYDLNWMDFGNQIRACILRIEKHTIA